jgi:hypothetical protein
MLEQVLSAQLLTEVILGLEFLINYKAEISFPERRITLRVKEDVFKFEFTRTKTASSNRLCDLKLMSIHSQTQRPPTAVKKDHFYTKNFVMEGGDESVHDRKRAIGMRMEDSEYLLDDDDKESQCLLNDDNESVIQQSEKKCAENARTAKNERGRNFCRKSFAAVVEDKEIQNPDSFIADK